MVAYHDRGGGFPEVGNCPLLIALRRLAEFCVLQGVGIVAVWEAAREGGRS